MGRRQNMENIDLGENMHNEVQGYPFPCIYGYHKTVRSFDFVLSGHTEGVSLFYNIIYIPIMVFFFL